jgi:hypothetical protein
VGAIGRPGHARVDARGLVTPSPGGWSVDWWIGADDRWHFPAREATARQRLFEGGPVVETAIRVPGGDIVQRTYGVPGPDGGVVCVIEVENQTPSPVALAVALRPCNPDGPAFIGDISRQDRVVSVDGRPVLLLPRAPAHEAGSTLADGDVADIVTSGRAGTSLPSPLHCDAGGAEAAFLLPLTHRTTLRWAVAVEDSALPDTTTGLPDAGAVARGWQAQSDRGMRLSLPPGRLADAVEANRRYLLLSDRGGLGRKAAAAVGAALDHFGFHDEAAEMAPAHRRRRAKRAEGSLERLDEVLDAASPTYTWAGPHGPSSAAFLSLVRELLVRETPGGVALCSTLPPVWEGHPLEVHDAPTSHGAVSFAVRWHGQRPALLWERTPNDGGRSAVELTAPGLDPTWATTDLRGEALLSPRAGVPAGSRPGLGVAP